MMNHIEPSPLLDLAPPKKWRRLLPAWVRSLIWVDSAATYDAFLSYSWKSDRKVAQLIQSVLQQFLCPWYKLRAKTIFRDLSALAAGSNLQKELYERLDCSTHLIVLACPEAAHSAGMELEASYWFGRPRQGDVLIIVTDGDSKTWDEISKSLVPTAIRANLASEPHWIPLQHRRSEAQLGFADQKLRGQLVEDLKQVLLRLHQPRTWEELQGEERAQRRRALRAVWGVALLFLGLAFAAGGFAWYAQKERLEANRQAEETRRQKQAADANALEAKRQQGIAEQNAATAQNNARESRARELAAQSQQVADYDPAVALELAIQAGRSKSTKESYIALNRVLEGPLVHLILHHKGAVTRVVFSPDGKRIATGSDDGTARIWDAEKGTLLTTLNGHAGKVSAVTFSADGKRIVTGAENGTAQVWNVANGHLLLSLKEDDRDAGDVSETDFSRDGTRVVSAFTNGNADLWNASTGAKIASFQVCTDFVSHAAFSPDSKLLVTSGSGCVVAEVWDSTNGQPVKTFGHFDLEEAELFQGHGRPQGMANAVFSPDSQRLLTVIWHGETQLWDVQSGQLLGALGDPTTQITDAAFSPDGKRIVTATADSRVITWDVASLKPGEPFVGHTGSIFLVSFTPDGKRLVSASTDNTVRVWDAWDAARSHIAALGGGPAQSLLIDAAFSPDGKWIATGRRDNTARVWDTERSHPLTVLKGHSSGINDVEFSPDGKRLVTASWDSTARVWDAANWRTLVTLGGTASSKQDLSRGLVRAMFLADGTRVVTVNHDGAFNILETTTGRPVVSGRLRGPENVGQPRGDLAFSLDGKRVAAPSGDHNTAKVWDVESGRELANLDSISDIAFSPDGAQVATSSSDKKVRIWDVQTGRIVATFRSTQSICATVFLPDRKRILVAGNLSTAWTHDASSGRVLATFKGFHPPISTSKTKILVSRGGQRILTRTGGVWDDPELWDSRNGRLVATLLGHAGYITTVQFSPDGNRLLTASRDRTARIWDAWTGQLKAVLSGHAGPIEDASFSRDGLRLITVGWDDTVRLWDAENANLLATFHTVTEQPNHAVFSPDGKHILVVGFLPVVPVYIADFDELLKWAERQLPRQSGE